MSGLTYNFRLFKSISSILLREIYVWSLCDSEFFFSWTNSYVINDIMSLWDVCRISMSDISKSTSKGDVVSSQKPNQPKDKDVFQSKDLFDRPEVR